MLARALGDFVAGMRRFCVATVAFCPKTLTAASEPRFAKSPAQARDVGSIWSPGAALVRLENPSPRVPTRIATERLTLVQSTPKEPQEAAASSFPEPCSARTSRKIQR